MTDEKVIPDLAKGGCWKEKVRGEVERRESNPKDKIDSAGREDREKKQDGSGRDKNRRKGRNKAL